MRISDWSSDGCSSDLSHYGRRSPDPAIVVGRRARRGPFEMRTAGWRSVLIYGSAIILCQPLAACGSAEAPSASTNDKVAAKTASAIPADAPLVIAFGDSLYAGYQLGPKEGLAPQLPAAPAEEDRKSGV